MSFLLIKYGKNMNVPCKRFVADTESDKDQISLSGVPMGSTVYVIESALTYILNGNKEWVEK